MNAKPSVETEESRKQAELHILIHNMLAEARTAILSKVAQDWADREWRPSDTVGANEVQAFLDSRHVHYQECRKWQEPQ